MTTERIDIVVSESGSRDASRNIEGMGTGAKRSAQNLEILTKALDKIQGAADRMEAQLQGANKILDAIAKSSAATATGTEKLDKSLAGLSADVRAVTAALSKMSGGLASTGTAANASTAGTDKVNRSLTTLVALTGHVGSQVGTMNTALVHVSGSTQQTADNTAKLAKGMSVLVSESKKANTGIFELNTTLTSVDNHAGKTVAVLERMEKVLEQIARDSARGARGLDDVNRSSQRLGSASNGLLGSLGKVAALLATLGAAVTLAGVIHLLDEVTTLQNRLRASGAEGTNLDAVFRKLTQTANETRSSLKGTVELYARLATSSKELGVSQSQLIDFTKSLNQAVILSGASAQEAEAGIIQLAQGMASGRLQGDELRSILEQLPAVADVIAKSMGVTRGELRKLGSDGKISAGIVLKAFKDAREELNERFAKTVPTISQSFQVLKNNFSVLIGEFDKGTGISAALSKALLFISNNLDSIVRGVAAVVIGITAVGGTITVINAVRNAVLLLNVAISTNPIGLLATALSVVITAAVSAVAALYLFRNEISLGIDKVTTLGDLLKAFGEIAVLVFNELKKTVSEVMDPVLKIVQKAFGEMEFSVAGFVTTTASILDRFVGIWVTAFNLIINFYTKFGDAFRDLTVQAVNGALGYISDYVNTAGKLLSPITTLAGQKDLLTFDFKIDNKTEGAAEAFGKGVTDAIQSGMDFKLFSDVTDLALKRAQELAKFRLEADKGTVGTVGGTAAPLKDPDADKKAKKLRNELEQLVSQYDSVYAAQLEVSKATKLLDKAQAAGLITSTRRKEVMSLISEQLRDQLNPLAAINREMDRELSLMGLTADKRELSNQLLSIEQDLRAKGVRLSQQERADLEAKLKLTQDQLKVQQATDQLRNSSRAGRDAQFGIETEAMKKVTSQGGVDKNDQFNFLNSALGGSLDNTKAELEARAAQMEEYFARIDVLRQKNLISEQTASDAIRAIKDAEVKANLNRVSESLGAAAGLMQSNNKQAFALGKAAAIGQATINTYLAATAAYASGAKINPVFGAIAAAGAVAAGLAQVQQIRAQQLPAYATGGSYTVGGNGGVDSQTVAFRATPGEKININTPAQARAAENLAAQGRQEGKRAPTVVHQTINVAGRVDNRTADQMARESSRRLTRATARS